MSNARHPHRLTCLFCGKPLTGTQRRFCAPFINEYGKVVSCKYAYHKAINRNPEVGNNHYYSRNTNQRRLSKSLRAVPYQCATCYAYFKAKRVNQVYCHNPCTPRPKYTPSTSIVPEPNDDGMIDLSNLTDERAALLVLEQSVDQAKHTVARRERGDLTIHEHTYLEALKLLGARK